MAFGQPNEERAMKIWVDLLSTDYGLMSLTVITIVLVAMAVAAVYVLRRINQ